MQFSVWYDIMPFGQWWDYAVRHIPDLLMVYRETPQKIFDIPLNFGEHKSDVARLEAILVLGKVLVSVILQFQLVLMYFHVLLRKAVISIMFRKNRTPFISEPVPTFGKCALTTQTATEVHLFIVNGIYQ